MALARTRRDASRSSAATTTFSSGAFTPTDGSLLVMVLGFTDNRTSGWSTPPTISGGGLTWTQRVWQYAAAQYGGSMAIYTAVVGTGASMTVTADYGATNAYTNGVNMAVYEYTGAQNDDPVGLTATGGAHASRAASAYSLSLGATITAGSEVLAGAMIDELQATGYVTAGTGYTEDVETGVGALVGMQLEYSTTSVNSVEYGNLQASFMWRVAAVEIKELAAFFIRPDADDTLGTWTSTEVVAPTKTFVDDNVATAASSVASATFTPADNSLLVVCAGGVPNGNGPTSVTISGGSLTWTLREFSQHNDLYGSWVGLWTAPVTTGASMSVTVSCTAETQESVYLSVHQVTGYRALGDGGVAQQIGNQTADNLTGAYSAALNPGPDATSLLIALAMANGNAGVSASSITTNASWTEDGRNSPSAATVYVSMSRTGQTSGQILVDTMTCNFVRSIVGIEIKGLSTLYSAIDETTASDTDYMQSASDPSNDLCKIRLGNPTVTPGEPMKVHYRARKTGSADLRVRLLEGTTQIASWTESALTTSYTTYEKTLSAGEFAAISDFTNLYLEFRANKT